MEQKELNNLSAEELDAMADALLAADDAKQAETKAAPAVDDTQIRHMIADAMRGFAETLAAQMGE